MKAISLWQPWASLVIVGVKGEETRSWRPPKDLIGARVAIHAAMTTKGLKVVREDRELAERFATDLKVDSLDVLPRGVILGTAVIEAVFPTERCGANLYGDFSPGRCAWFLTDVNRFAEPLPWKGRQGFFEWDGDR